MLENLDLRFWIKRLLFGKNKSNAWLRGMRGESKARKFLKKKGLRIVAKNWRAGRGEVDVICLDSEVLVFVEIRSRSETASVTGYHSVGLKKKKILKKTCLAYLDGLACSYRFDIVDVVLSDEKEDEVYHYENIPLFG